MPHSNHNINEEIRTCTEATVVECINLANRFYNRRIKMPKLDWSLKGQTAGQLVTRRVTPFKAEFTLRLNHELLEKNFEYYMREVIPHEISHLVADWIFGHRIKPHGKEWQSIMQDCFELEPKVYHSLASSPARHHPRHYLYKCQCQTHAFTTRRHRNAQKGSTYQCKNCHANLVFDRKDC